MIDARYLAGVMDSDGCFSVTKQHPKRKNCSYTGMVQLTWTRTKQSEKFIRNLSQRYGGTYYIIMPSNTGNFKNCRPVVKYGAKARAAEAIVRDVLPHLVLKKRQANNILKLYSVLKDTKTPGKTRLRKVTNRLDKIYLKNRMLNGKNGVQK